MARLGSILNRTSGDRARTGSSSEKGQALVLFAGGLVLFLGLVGMSVDIGLLMYRKAALQRAADAAALAGALDLAKVTPDTAAADASARFYISANEGGLDADGPNAAVTFSSTNRANDTINVTLTESVPFTFLPFVGVNSGSASASAGVVARAATGAVMDEQDVFPYAVWGGPRTEGHNNSCPYNICLGSTQVYRSNHWDSDSYVYGSDYAVNGNNFKGYFHAGGDVVQISTSEWQTFSKGGNALGQEPLDALDAHIASGEPIVLPVVSAVSCTGGCGEIKFKIVAWVALKITARGNPSRAWTGKVVEWSSPAVRTTGPQQAPAAFPSVFGFSLAN